MAPHLWCQVSLDRLKIGFIVKTVTDAKLMGRFCSFFRRSKSQL